MSERNRSARALFSGLPARYDVAAEVLSFGQNGRWRRAMVAEVAAARPRTILDVATGTAGVAFQLARRTGASITGVDISDEMLARGRANVAAQGLDTRITLMSACAEALPFPAATFDAVTFTYLLRYVDDPAATIRELVRVLRPGGVLANLEFFVPPRRALRTAWWIYTRALLPVGGLPFGRAWWDVGRFLGPSISGHYRRYPLDWTVRAWEAAGAENVRTRVMSLGGGLVMWGRRARD
ncbi:MAG: class I SAM-dependent methyltransferase [Actinobacteria bacterium]|nr:class I SAM-dependent methyltransferase [Actinomycetota bacterium]